MNALVIVIVALCVFALAYRFYGLFIANRVLGLDPKRKTPAYAMEDGQDYHPTNRFVIFGHHFAAIAAAGPLMGPVLAAQFGYLPGALWIIIGAVVAGAVHDMVVLFASVRHQGKSLAVIAEDLLGKRAGLIASIAVLFILILTLAGLSISVVNAMFSSPWSTYTIFSTIPIALLMGVYIRYVRPGDYKGATILGVALLFIVLLTGPYVSSNPTLASALTLSKNQVSIFVPVYGFFASVLPVWLLLCPRDYLSTYLKIGMIIALAIGIFAVHPDLQMPAVTQYINGGGPVVNGPLFPFLFITIACGALSGFHAIIGTGTTPKMISSEKDILFVGYGAMLVEAFVAIMALIAACILLPQDYFAINAAPAVYATLNMAPVHLPAISQAVGEQLVGRTGGAVSLAVGIASILSAIPFMSTLTAYWYHFAIMFEAIFILTAVDTGTRVGRYLLQELIGKVRGRPVANAKADPMIVNARVEADGGAFSIKNVFSSRNIEMVLMGLIFTLAWGYLLYTGNISTIWPIFGMCNQLLAACGLILGTTMILKMGKARYAWITAIPGLFMLPVTMIAGYMNIVNNYWPKGLYLLVALSVIVMVLMAILVIEALIRWYMILLGNKDEVPGVVE